MMDWILDEKHYLQFLYKIGMLETDCKDAYEWVKWFDNNPRQLAETLLSIGRILNKKSKTVLYPPEMIVVPRYPFTKQPMIRWSTLQKKSPSDHEVTYLKEICGKAGYRINVGFLLRHFVLIDIDGKPDALRKYADIETRRGFHLIRYIPDYPALKFKFNNTAGGKVTLVCGDTRIEIMSGSGFLGSHPEQSRYLEFVDGKVNVRRYKYVSQIAEFAFRSADLTPIKASIEEVRELISAILKELGYEGHLKHLEIEGIEKEETTPDIPDPATRESRFNRETLLCIGALSYEEFKKALEKHKERLPVCVRQALFGNIEHGTRYFHLRLLLAILPYFVLLDQQNLKEMNRDFAERSNSNRSDERRSVYRSKYYTGKLRIGDMEAFTVSKLGVPLESWSYFETSGYCSNCCLKDSCLGASGSKRRRLIIQYIESLLGREA